jgi:hypothetical protein
VNAFQKHCKEIASHKHGCMVMQKCLYHWSDDQRLRLTEWIVEECLDLSQNQFGNYIVQNIIQMNNFEQNQSMLKIFSPHLVTLCSQKFSSNVVEKVSVGKVTFSASKTSMT